MQFPIIIGLRPSFIVRGGILLVHLAAALAIATSGAGAVILCALMVLACLSGYRAWIAIAGPHPSRLRLLADGRIDVEVGEGSWQHAETIGSPRIHPWLTLVRLRWEAGLQTLVIAPDAINGEDFRRLRVWLRWRKSPNADG